MSSLVSDFLINPVLRQARRFSRSEAPVHTHDSNDPLAPHPVPGNNNESDEVFIEDVIEGEAVMDLPDTRNDASVDNIIQSSSNPSGDTHNLQHEADRSQIDPLAHSHIQSNTSLADRNLSGNLSSSTIPQTHGEVTEGSSSNATLNVLDLQMSPAEGTSQHPSQNSTSASIGLDTGSSALPADDGMGPLRQRIKYIQAMDIPTEQKALLMHQLLTQGYTEAHELFHAKNYVPTTTSDKTISQERPATPGSLSSFIWQMNGALDLAPATEIHTFHLSPGDLQRTYAPLDTPENDFGSEESESTEDLLPQLGSFIIATIVEYAERVVVWARISFIARLAACLSILSDPEVEAPAIGTGDAQNDMPTSQEPREISSSTYLIPGLPRNRRHSSHIPSPSSQGESGRFSPYPVPSRLGRSVSPARGLGLFANQPMGGGESDSSGDEDDLDFWGRDEPRSARDLQGTHDTDAQDDNDIEYEDDSTDSESGNDYEEDDDGEEEPFAIFGHR
ncbi:hypothetical protein EYC84_010748 [Monilinia fructicola]|uniref:Uncharacterized protein n=1 Tax=Monilinia fructicola TaxID=38448 RepID=A0A5M9JAR2_MONFR|nr:hypothetical protein EYC84_010748 [Monilinia fructicola]